MSPRQPKDGDPGEPGEAPAPPKGWSWADLLDASAMWENAIGYLPPGRIGRALKPLVASFGWVQIKPWWKQYLEMRPLQDYRGDFTRTEPDYRFMSPEEFVRTYRIWQRFSEAADA